MVLSVLTNTAAHRVLPQNCWCEGWDYTGTCDYVSPERLMWAYHPHSRLQDRLQGLVPYVSLYWRQIYALNWLCMYSADWVCHTLLSLLSPPWLPANSISNLCYPSPPPWSSVQVRSLWHHPQCSLCDTPWTGFCLNWSVSSSRLGISNPTILAILKMGSGSSIGSTRAWQTPNDVIGYNWTLKYVWQDLHWWKQNLLYQLREITCIATNLERWVFKELTSLRLNYWMLWLFLIYK